MKKTKTVIRLLGYAKRHAPLIAVSVILAAVSSLFSLYIPILIGRAIDFIVGENAVDFKSIAELLTKAGITVAAVFVSQWLMSSVNNKIAFDISKDMRGDAIRKIEELPLSYIDAHPAGDTVSRVISDVEQVCDGLIMGLSQFFTGIVTIFGTIGFMIYLNASIALVVILITPLSLFVAWFISKKTYKLFRVQSEIRGEQTAFINETVTNQKVVKAFSREQPSTDKFEEINSRLEKSTRSAIFFSSLTNPSTRFVNSVVYAGVCLFGAFAVVSSGGTSFSVGALSSFLAYANQYTKPFNEISGVIAELQGATVCASRVFELLDEPSQSPDGTEEFGESGVSGNVSIENVSFSYTPDRPLIENFDLDVSAGKHIAIVGPTGCGKTTLINLLMRFYDVNGGKIKVDGKDVKNVKRKELRRSYGMVLQDTWLKEGTVRENIAFGKPDATDEEIIAAAKASHAHSFIRKLENGYDTVIGEDGGRLSQGQKQLLCITRVMLALPSMLILDEATSSIDTRTEMKIQSGFLKMMRGRTSFVVAHRLSTIRDADTILVMNDGHIVEKGSHEELLQKDGFYRKLYDSQFAK